MDGFHQAVVIIQRHDDCILSITTCDNGAVCIVYDLIENSFEAIPCISKGDYTQGSLRRTGMRISIAVSIDMFN